MDARDTLRNGQPEADAARLPVARFVDAVEGTEDVRQFRGGNARSAIRDSYDGTGDLDRRAGDEILELLRVLNHDHRKTIVMVTHDPRAADAASRVLHLEKGQLAAEVAA